MKILIAGGGKIGYSVADTLSKEGHDITVIDSNPDTIYNLSNNLDVICVEGSATNPETLLEAGAADADLILAAMRSDEMNMVCGISARKLGTKHVIVRIRDTEYLSHTEFLREALGLSVVVNPELECAREISHILRFPSAIKVEAFSKGSAELIEHRIPEGSLLDGVMMKELQGKFNAKVLISAVVRDGEAIIPNGDFTLKAGDLFSVTGSSRELRKFFVAAGQYRKSVKNVMIMGGGRIAVHLARLLDEAGIAVTVVESNRARCDELCDIIPQARIIHGDATRGEVLLEEGLKGADGFVALTGDDGDNIIASVFAQHCNVGKIVVKVNREYYSDILMISSLDSVVTPKAIVAQQLVRYVRAMSNSLGSSMETLYRLAEGKVEALEFRVGENSACVGTALKQLRLKPNVLISAIVRGNDTIIPDGDTVICPGDHAVIVTTAAWLTDLDSIVEGH